MKRVLVVEDDQAMLDLLKSALTKRGFEVRTLISSEQALNAISADDFDVVLTDLNMPRINGMELCEKIVANFADLPVIVVTAFGNFDTAVQALRAGAFDFITKPVDLELLSFALQRAVEMRGLKRTIKRLQAEGEGLATEGSVPFLLGDSEPMRRLTDIIRRVAPSSASLFITGESGSGKELVARAIHQVSDRKDKPFVAINCAALPENLLEAELFGHSKGAFTDAKNARDGLFVEADGGTLFLDEIGEMPIALQPKLLRILEDHKVRALGSSQERSVDVRVLAATNRDLERLVELERFREDLLFRLNVVQIDVPPLRARGTDILVLARKFLTLSAKSQKKAVKEISPQVAERLLTYAWPGNVRELRNIIERAVLLTQFDTIVVEDLPERIRAYRSHDLVLGTSNPEETRTLDMVERDYILHVLKVFDGNRSAAAKALGLDRKTLYRKLLQYGVADDV